MKLHAFRQHLQEIDQSVGSTYNVFDFSAESVGEDAFNYTFDGTVLVTVRFHKDRVEETYRGMLHVFSDAAEWKNFHKADMRNWF